MAMAAQAPHKHTPAAAAVAVEMVHTFSLIHDDMPCIDNATLRRGQPCTHKAYGEAAGLLAGDLLLNEAYRVLSRNYPSALAGKLTHILSETTFGLLEGEWADIEAEEKEIDEVDIDFIYLNKTAKMISAPVKMGLTIAGYSEKKILPFALAAEDVGIAFQIIDDLLDINSSAAKLGKDVDQDERKKTYLKRHGEKWCRDKARELSLSAQKTFKQLPRPQFILSLINALMEREK
jgi:geranylgeranyl diphosphate synthase type II